MEIIQAISQLAKWAGTYEELEAVKTCLQIFKLEHRKRPDLNKICDDAEAAIYKRNIDLKFLYNDKSNY